MAPEKEDAKQEQARRALNAVTSTAAKAHLECTAGPEKGQTLRMAPGVTVMGRDASCDVVLAETAISRQHARIERRAEQWVLLNMSSNGTLVNKKTVDEVALADGDEIRIGAKTHLRFVIESVAATGIGRPQFRRRTGAPEPQEAKGEDKGETDGTPPSLFKRRKNLFIGLGIYFAAMLVLLAVGLFYGLGGTGLLTAREIPVLGLDDMVHRPGMDPLRVVGEETAEGVMCAGSLPGENLLIPRKDLDSGKAVIVPGIRKALEVKYLEKKNARKGYLYVIDEPNPLLAERCKKQAIDLYHICKLPGKESSLFGSVRLFQQALAYAGGRGYFDDPATEKIYQDALKDLVGDQDRPGTVLRNYNNAIVLDKNGSYKQAWTLYQHILSQVPEPDNPLCENVKRRIADLMKHHSDLK